MGSLSLVVRTGSSLVWEITALELGMYNMKKSYDDAFSCTCI